MGDSSDNVVIGVVLWLIALSGVMAAVGIWLGRSHRLRSRRIALIWAIASIAPLFGAGAYMYLRHSAMEAEGVTRPGVTNVPPGQGR